MNQKKDHRLMEFVLLLGMSFWVVIAGCAGTPKIPAPVYEEVELPTPLVVAPDYEVADPDDPEQLIKMGVLQSQKERPGYAKDIFGMASALPSPDNRLQLSSSFAIAYEYLRSGNRDAFVNTMQQIDVSLSKFQRASLSEYEAIMMALYDVGCGRDYISGTHPAITREFFVTPAAE